MLEARASSVRSRSAGLSSTKRISGLVGDMTHFLIGLMGRQREIKSAPMTQLRFDPDFSSIVFDNFLTDCQPHAVPGVFVTSVQPLKDDENQVFVFRGDANTVIDDRKLPMHALSLCGDPNDRRLLSAKLDGIANQVLEELHHLDSLGRDHGTIFVDNDSRALVNR